MTTVRVATLNVWNKSGPWLDRLRLIRSELDRLRPSLVGLQEVLRFVPDESTFVPTGVTCQATEIAAGTGFSVAYAAASDYGGGLRFGNALLSSFPILEQAVFELPSLGSGESRSLLYVRVETEFGELPVFVTHLNWKLHHASVRLEQVKFIVDRIADLAKVGGAYLPPVLLGDFNAEPEADEIRYLRGLSVVEGRSVFFADAWVYGGDGSLGATFDRKNAYASRAHEPPRRIDYIFVRGPDALLRGEPIHTELAFADAEGSGEAQVWPSDHFGLVSDIWFSPRSP
jgi:endonuclease/exonuclease/phosphatase family metal-dependent hydrolase